MEYREVVDHLAPCGLDCSRCADYEDGEIKELSARLLQCLGNYGRLAGLRAGEQPRFGGYSQFEDILAHFSQASCGGCRAQNNQCPFNCKVATCHKEKRIDFCFQCKEFPCDGGDPRALTPVGERWQKMNDRMKQIGVIGYYVEQSRLPRY